MSPTIGDVHRVWNALADQTSISIHVYGANIGKVGRHVFHDDGTVKDFVSGYSNAKLEDRALRILRDLAGVPREGALDLLRQAGGSVRLALLMAASGLGAEAARAALERHGPGLRQCLEALEISLPPSSPPLE